MVLLTLFGFFMAILANMTGIEGGMIFVPLFILLFGLSPQEAAGVSMATMVFGLGAGSLAYARQRRIDFRLGLVLLAVSVPGTIIGALLTPYLPAKTLELLLGLLLVPLGLRMIFRRELGKLRPAMQEPSSGWARVWIDRGGTEFRYFIRHLPLGLLLYFFIGFMAGLLGIGGGAIKVPTLILLLGSSTSRSRSHLRIHDGLDGTGRRGYPWRPGACSSYVCPLLSSRRAGGFPGRCSAG